MESKIFYENFCAGVLEWTIFFFANIWKREKVETGQVEGLVP
jgi:hypothetical protein